MTLPPLPPDGVPALPHPPGNAARSWTAVASRAHRAADRAEEHGDHARAAWLRRGADFAQDRAASPDGRNRRNAEAVAAWDAEAALRNRLNAAHFAPR